MNFQVIYGNGCSITPTQLMIDAEEIATALSSSQVVSKKRVWDLIYMKPRHYSTIGSTNFIWLDVEQVSDLIAWARDEVAPNARSEYEQTARGLTKLCGELKDYKRMTFQMIGGVLNNVKI